MIIYQYMKYYLLPIFLIITIVLVMFAGNFSSIGSKVELNKKIQAKIFDKYESEFVFVFFGYVGCADICTPRLEELSNIQIELKNRVEIETVFVNLTKLQDHELPQLFASTFNKEFNGVYLNSEELREVKSEFGIYGASSLMSDEEFDHTSFLFLLQKIDDRFYLKRIYTHVPFSKEIIIEDVIGNLND